jgi:adenylate cyclase
MRTSRIVEQVKPAPLATAVFSSSAQASAGRTLFRASRKNAVNPRNFFAELKRRNVYRAAAAYGVVSWLLVQIATQVFPFFEIPTWAIRMVIVVLLLGFPVALITAWIYELTPEGLQRTDDVAPGKSLSQTTGRKIDFAIIGVLLVVIAFMAWQHFHPGKLASRPDPPRTSVAILPFLDLSQSRDQEYLSDGITEQIIDSLAHLHDLFVVARTTAFSFKNKSGDIREIGRQLKVTHVLEGSVRRGNGRVRIAAQLIDVANGFHVWSESYDSTEQDLLSLQSDVARKVATALRIELHLTETKQLAKPVTQNPEAYDSYLRGRYLINKGSVESIEKGRALFEEAIAKDPNFALGHAGIADSYILLCKLGALLPGEAAPIAWSEVTAALALDDKLAEGYISRGILLNDFDWNGAAAEKDYRRAQELSPNSAEARHWYARELAQFGRFEEALREIGAAEKLDPLSAFIRTSKAKILWAARRYDDAIPQCLRALDFEPNLARPLSILAQCYLQQNHFPEGIAAAKRYDELSGGSGWSKLEVAYAYAISGDKVQADRIVAKVIGQGAPFSAYDMATISAVENDKEAALRWLEKAIEQRSVDVIWIRVDPRLDNIRNEPHFREIAALMVARR